MKNQPLPYELKRSYRTTIALEVSRDLRVVVRAPAKMPVADINVFVSRHKHWIAAHLEKQRRRAADYPEPTPEETLALKEQALSYIPPRVAHYAALMRLTPSAVKITGAKSRHGSCSSKNSLCFSYRLMMYPSRAIDYVIVHELAHIVHKNHGDAFYRLIEQYLPDWRERRSLLKG